MSNTPSLDQGLAEIDRMMAQRGGHPHRGLMELDRLISQERPPRETRRERRRRQKEARRATQFRP